MGNQYLMLAENITYKNNKLSCINVIDQFFVVKLPAEAQFDLVAICGPEWEPGECELTIKVQADEGDIFELGKTNIKIPNSDFVYNALAPDMKVRVDEGTKYIRFYVYRDEELILQRSYKVGSLLVQQEVAQ